LNLEPPVGLNIHVHLTALDVDQSQMLAARELDSCAAARSNDLSFST
jgi:hypothetical protein